MKVLVVDDDPSIVRLLMRQLALIGHESTPSFDGVSAIEKLKTESFDLVITDIVMPKANGIEVTDYICQHLPQVPVITISGIYIWDRPDLILNLAGKIAAFLDKPFDISQLSAVIDRLQLRGPEPGIA